MHWRIKGAIQKVLGAVPQGEKLHYLLQRRGGGLRDVEREVSIKCEDFALMVGHLSRAGIDVKGTRFLEMGTGWYPTFPFSLYLAGAASVDTVDLNRHLKPELTLACAKFLDAPALVEALERGASLEDATGGVVRYRAPADASDTKLPDGSIDVVFSNSVLEHVPGGVIERCFTEAMRILRPGGVVFHSVNCGDHYAYVDKSIDQLNYLRYSEAEWAVWNNEFLYQNRLRASDFTAMAKDAGFAIELDTSRPNPIRLAQLDRTPVHADFARYSRDQLAITSIDFIARKPA
jgi:SAM-dependent methyltransferase